MSQLLGSATGKVPPTNERRHTVITQHIKSMSLNGNVLYFLSLYSLHFSLLAMIKITKN